ncbi:SRPBCC family protein [Psychroflexus sp. CAK57W]|uniref:SRPBCC family protein n=1 Tax=Psychroflexus curvus TaxID=2873595 RepID=UPI001CCCBBCC|nr:SRPBCC family protein [Psychroflexus curvus]MBZ9628035.1 SRPBCC family protein [Psychroflexus curvus]MBZ9787734.1 SRPBCC family protein [Psychroflexus curvus]
MKYTTEIIIDKPREDILKVFEDPDLLPHWQRGLKRSRVISGKGGEVGSKRKLYITIEGQSIKMTETIIKKNLPEEWHGKYTSKGMESLQKNYFEALSENKTRWTSYSEFEFTGFMKLISKLLPDLFKKRSVMVQQDFKVFVEDGKRVKTN